LRARSTRQRVRSVVAEVGGYWRPLAAVARLLEELGELGELLDAPSARLEDFASELADLWIITTAVADQFLGDVAEPGWSAEGEPPAGGSITELLTAAGRIARLVNYYDGPKIPRSISGPSLNSLVADFHSQLARIASARGIDLASAVNVKLDAIPALDAGRFAQRGHDPSTAHCLDAFRRGATTELGPNHREARLWGGPAWSDGSIAFNAMAIVPTLTSFARAAAREQLDCYVIMGPEFSSMDSLAIWREDLLRELSCHDPDQPGKLRDDVGDGDSPFSFGGLAMSVRVVSPPRDRGAAPRSSTRAFVVMAPYNKTDPWSSCFGCEPPRSQSRDQR
jgi:hypothetical protein